MKTIQDAVEHFDGVWPEHVPRSTTKTFTIGERIYGNVKNIGEIRALRGDYSKAHFRVICTREEFEDYVTANQTEEKAMTKYKSVPVTDMTIWQLGQAVSEGGEFYNEAGAKIFISKGKGLSTFHQAQQGLERSLRKGEITTREPIEWYEQEGVFPCLVKWLGCVFFVSGVKGENLTISGDSPKVVPVIAATPLTREEAAEYGVE